jgi:hypothetical protein
MPDQPPDVLTRLKAKFPEFKIKYPPSPTCPQCKGDGEYRNRGGHDRPCPCVCICGFAAEALHKTLPKKFREEGRDA